MKTIKLEDIDYLTFHEDGYGLSTSGAQPSDVYLNKVRTLQPLVSTVKITLSLDSSDKDKLESIAAKFGYVRGKSPSISALIRAITQGDLEVSPPKKEIARAIAIIEEQLKEIRP